MIASGYEKPRTQIRSTRAAGWQDVTASTARNQDGYDRSKSACIKTPPGGSSLIGALRGVPAEGVAENARSWRLKRGEGFPLMENSGAVLAQRSRGISYIRLCLCISYLLFPIDRG